MPTKFEQPGTFPKAGPIGRTVRFLAGALIFYLIFPPFLQHWEAFTRWRAGWEMPGGTWYVAVLIALWLLPGMLDRGFTLNWGTRAWLVWGVLAIILIAFDFLFRGSLWGPPLGWLLLLTVFYVFGHLTLSFLVAALAATPG